MNDPGVIVLISANAEWRAAREILDPQELHSTVLGEYFDLDDLNGNLNPGFPIQQIRFFHGGWGKISAAATTQYAIDHWQPSLLVNLGTCGGFEGQIERGTILLVTKTIVYDIVEQMSDPVEAVAHYTTELDLSWLNAQTPHPVRSGPLVSGDRDILASDIPALIDKYNANAADWESGPIAWTAKKNNIPCIILRGVTDLVGPSGGEAYGNIQIFHENTRRIMHTLIKHLPDWIEIFQKNMQKPAALFKKIDCIRLYVPDLEEGLVFYRDKLGHQLLWRNETAAGLRMPGSEAEIVIQCVDKNQEVDLTVTSADQAARLFAEAGGKVIIPPFDIQIGRCAVVHDPWDNELVLLDTSKGLLATDEYGNVCGNK
jgi:adenosylhomocysteine nucleosidase